MNFLNIHLKLAFALLSLTMAQNTGFALDSKSSPKVLTTANESTSSKKSTIDCKKYGEYATNILCDYLKIDTTVPPGNEKLGADYLKGILDKHGIECKTFKTAKNRAIVYGRLKGNGSKKAIILLNHIDVVPARAEDWKYPPFSGSIHDGEIWGRGAIDMKGMGVVELVAMIMLKESGIKLDRDIIFLGTPDEEVGGIYGAGWFKKNKPEIIKGAEFLINEGFSIESYEPAVARRKGKSAKYWGIDYAEKSVLWLKLSAKGPAGHASMPLPGASTYRLVSALNKIAQSGPRFELLPPVEEYFTKIAASEEGQKKALFSEIKKTIKDSKHTNLLLNDVLKSSMLRNTISLTKLKAGYKTNVIPAEASAHLDCRLLPGVEKDNFIAWMKETIKDPEIKIEVLEWEKTGPSSMDTELVRAIKAVAKEEDPNTPVVPIIVPWFTDSHWFRELGVSAYGFMPFGIDKTHFATMHGVDERIPIKELEKGVERMYKILLRVAKQP